MSGERSETGHGTAGSRWRELVVVACAALVVAVLLTWPMAARMASTVPYEPRFGVRPEGSDTHLFVWNCWWAGQAVERGVDPFQCDRIFHPRGHSLALHTHTFLWGLVSVPLQWICGLPCAYNATLLACLAATAAAVFALGRYVGLGRSGAGLAAFAWTFSPYFMQKGLEHLNLFATPWPPLFLLWLLRWMDAAGPAAVRKAYVSAGVAGVVLGASLLTSMLSSLYVLGTGLLAVVLRPSIRAEERRGRLGGLVHPGAWILATLMMGLVAWPWLAAVARDWSALAGTAARDQLYHPRLGDFFTPPGLHPLFAGLGAGAALEGNAWPGYRAENAGLYLSFAVLSASMLAAVFVPRSRRWVLCAVPWFVLAWDPGPDPAGWLSNVYRHLPVLELLRVPARAWPYALLPLALAAGMGFEAMLQRTRVTRVIGLAFACLLVFEYWIVGYPSMPFAPPEAVRAIARAETSGAVIVLPFAPGSNEAMSWQTVHEQPVLVSYVARSDPARFVEWRETLPDLFLLAQGVRIPAPAELAADLACADVAHVLVRTDTLADPSLLYRLLDEMEGWARADTRDGVAWWYDTSRLFSAEAVLQDLRAGS